MNFQLHNVVFTGEAPVSTKVPQERKFWTQMAQEAGHTVKSSVSKNTTILVCSYKAAKDGTTKWQKAHDLHVRMVSYEDFYFNFC